jgi:putative nucleotidyltransferase with HDIG domain
MENTKINFKNIPVQAGIIANIIKLEVDSNNCFQELENLISSDQGVASLVLRVVNSPFYSRGNKVATIPFAISLLGYTVVRSLALMAFSRSLFSHTKNVLFRQHIWQHSLLTAIASQSVCEKAGEARQSDEAFIAGLMHDTGKVLMFTHNAALYEDVLKYTLTHQCSSVLAELKYFGFDHCEVGLEAVKEWKLPERFNDYMGMELNVITPAHQGDIVFQSLAAANYVIKSAGVGAKAVEDAAVRKAALLGYGLDESLSDELLDAGFIDGLLENETYQLCANI